MFRKTKSQMNGNPKLDLRVFSSTCYRTISVCWQKLSGMCWVWRKKSNKCSTFLPQLRQKMIQLKKSNSTHDTSCSRRHNPENTFDSTRGKNKLQWHDRCRTFSRWVILDPRNFRRNVAKLKPKQKIFLQKLVSKGLRWQKLTTACFAAAELLSSGEISFRAFSL